MGKADLHIHSTVSDGMASVDQIMVHVQEKTDLDVVAITDHDAVAGSLAAVEWADGHPECRFRVVFATEITAALGRHLLAYFFRPPYPTSPFPRLRSYQETVDRIHEMGGVVAIPHPTVAWTPSGGYRQILQLLRDGVSIDAIEVCNAAPAARGKSEKVRIFNDRDFHLAELGGSDAHHLAQIGSAYTIFQGSTPTDLEQQLSQRTSKAEWGLPVTVPWQDHVQQVFKSWVEKPTRGLRAGLLNR